MLGNGVPPSLVQIQYRNAGAAPIKSRRKNGTKCLPAVKQAKSAMPNRKEKYKRSSSAFFLRAQKPGSRFDSVQQCQLQ
jgi:hypothetical protein